MFSQLLTTKLQKYSVTICDYLKHFETQPDWSQCDIMRSPVSLTQNLSVEIWALRGHSLSLMGLKVPHIAYSIILVTKKKKEERKNCQIITMRIDYGVILDKIFTIL